MTTLSPRLFFTLALSSFVSVLATHADEPPTEWVDSATGHRIIRLSKEPGSASLYFHQNAYSADKSKLIITSPSGISTVDLKTRAIDLVVPGTARVLMTGRVSNRVYYTKEGAVWASDLTTHEAKEIAKFPKQYRETNVAINADESTLVCVAEDSNGTVEPRKIPEGYEKGGLAQRWSEGRPMVTYTVDLKTGQVNVIHREHDWTNHLQCSPTDPKQILFCHEGPWHFNDRSWAIRTDGTGLTQLHTRTMEMEIAGHEFFSADGKTVWYDLQTPRSMVFWLAGVDLTTGERTWYNLEREEWSVHYNVSNDGKLFAGDGAGPNSVANHTATGEPLPKPGNGQWIYLFRPVASPNRAAFLPGHDKLIRVGKFKSERLADLSKHDYHLEPNLTFTPDDKWLVFRSNMFGPSHVFAVEIAPAK